MNFDDLNLHPKIAEGALAAGYVKPTKIQLEAIPKIMEGRDLRASANTGTGKTAAFLLPALNLLTQEERKTGKGPRVLILVPTRELAMQIAAQSQKYSKFLKHLKTVSVFGGVPYPPQERQLSRPYDVLIATPGRLIDFIHKKKVNLSRVELVVLDEADRMLDMGFVEPVEEIITATPASRQVLLFSATLKGSVVKLSERLLKNPVEIAVESEREEQSNIEQKLYYSDDLNHKNRILDYLLCQGGVENAIVFTSTKRHADQLVDELKEKGHQVAALHGNMNQKQRSRTIARFREGRFELLIATDVAARGIDVRTITHVINFDLPNSAEDYVHRIGRTGRGESAKGVALSLVGRREIFLVKKIEAFTRQPIAACEIPGLEPQMKKRHFHTPKKGSSFHSHKGSNRGRAGGKRY